MLCGIYEEEENWESMERSCGRALAENLLDEDIHCHMMRSLYRQKKYELALDHCEKANKMFYENFGFWNPEKLNGVFREMVSEQTKDLEKIIHDSLHSGDVAAKFGPAQFALMLPSCSYEESIDMAQCIQRKFRKNQKRNRMGLMYEIVELNASV